MNKAQTLLLSGALTLGTVFAAHAQTAANDGKLIAINDPAKTEVVDNKKDALEPRVREGQFSDALALSYNNKIMVVYIYGAKGTTEKPEPYTARQYAEILQKAFANPKYTDNPTDVVVVYNETGRDGVSTASVLINGDKFETKSGRTTFTPMLVGKHIDTFADAHASANGVASYTSPDTKTTSGIALTQN